jgi:cysteinyl-tRNA synthetase
MITIDGKKMGKSLGNFITLEQMFTGNHPKLNQAYSPMTIRFFMLQAHYRSTLDFTNDALQASEKGLSRLMNGLAVLQRVKPSAESTVDIAEFEKSIYTAMDNDLNTPIVISTLFEWTKTFFALEEGKEKISAQDLELLRAKVDCVVSDILGLQNQQQSESNKELLDGVIGMVLAERQHAKERKDWATSDAIRDRLKELGIAVKDSREGATWDFSN